MDVIKKNDELLVTRGLFCTLIFIGHLFRSVININDQSVYLGNFYNAVILQTNVAMWLFFIISGYTMWGLYSNTSFNKPRIWLNFYLKRMVRLYIPCIAVYIAIGILNYYFSFTDLGTKESYYSLIIPFLQIDGRFNSFYTINPVVWTLVVDFSFLWIFPILVTLKNKISFNLIIMLFFSWLAYLIYESQQQISDINIINLFHSPIYNIGFFLTGMLLSEYKKKVHLFNLSKKLSLFIFVLALYGTDYYLKHFSFKNFVFYMPIIGCAICSFYLLTINLDYINRSITQISTPNSVKSFFEELGKISFVFYLLHRQIGYFFIQWAKDSHWLINPYIFLILIFIVTLAVSYAFFKCVEAPCRKIFNFKI